MTAASTHAGAFGMHWGTFLPTLLQVRCGFSADVVSHFFV